MSDLLWEIIMKYPIWDRIHNIPLCTTLEGFNLLNRIYHRAILIEKEQAEKE